MNKKRLGIEFVLIAVAVLLATGLTEWRQARQNKKQAEISFQNIIEEIQDNFEGTSR